VIAHDRVAIPNHRRHSFGLRENLAQFTLLVIVNAFVGAMVGLERSILPAIAEREFHLVARTAVLSFIVVFGVARALTNYGAGCRPCSSARPRSTARRRSIASSRIFTCSKSVTSCPTRSGVSRCLFAPAVAAFPISHRNDAGAHSTHGRSGSSLPHLRRRRPVRVSEPVFVPVEDYVTRSSHITAADRIARDLSESAPKLGGRFDLERRLLCQCQDFLITCHKNLRLPKSRKTEKDLII
jgi:hypothetical protein